MKNLFYLFISCLFISCGGNKGSSIPENCSENCFLSYMIEKMNIDSLSVILNIDKRELAKLHILENKLNTELKSEIIEYINDNDKIDNNEVISQISLLPLKNKKSVFLNQELTDNKFALNAFNYLLSKKIINTNKDIIDNEFGLFNQFKHMYYTFSMSEKELLNIWTGIIKKAYNKVNFNKNVENYEDLLEAKYELLNLNSINSNLLQLKSFDFNSIETTNIVEANNKKLINEVYDFTSDLIIGFFTWLILRFVFKSIVGRAIAQNDKFYSIFQDGYSSGKRIIESLSGKEYTSKNEGLFNFIGNLAVNFFNDSSNMKIVEKYKKQKKIWSSVLNTISFVVLLIIFVNKDIKLEKQLEQDLNTWTIENISTNIKLIDELNQKTIRAYEN